jgi:hypothetical protein
MDAIDAAIALAKLLTTEANLMTAITRCIEAAPMAKRKELLTAWEDWLVMRGVVGAQQEVSKPDPFADSLLKSIEDGLIDAIITGDE